MPNLVNKTRLKEVSEALWNKVKEREVTGGTFTKDTKTLELTKTSGNVNIDMDGIVTRWKDLEHVSENEHINVLDRTKTQRDKALANITGDIIDSSGWGIIEFNAIPSQTYTAVRKRDGSFKVKFEMKDGSKTFISEMLPNTGGYIKKTFTAPQGDIAKAFYEVYLDSLDTSEDMILKGDHSQTNITNYIPYADEKSIHVSNVSLDFNNSNTDIKSSTVESAIKELDKKIANAGTVTRWKDLEYVSEKEIINILNKTKCQVGKKLDASGDIIESTNEYGLMEFKPIPGQTYTVLRQRAGLAMIRFELADGSSSFISEQLYTIKNYNRASFTVPTNTVKAFYEVQLTHAHVGEEMILTGNHRNPQTDFPNYIPYSDDSTIQIGKEVSYYFDNSDTDIKSETVASAIKELSDSRKNFVAKWEDLEHVVEYPYVNLLDYRTRVIGCYSGSVNQEVWTENQAWSTCFIDVEEGQRYSVYRRNNDTQRFIFTNAEKGAKINAYTITNPTTIGEFRGGNFSIPTNSGITKLAIQFQHGTNGKNDIMVFKGGVNDFTDFIPYIDGNVIYIGKEVSYEFDNTGTNIQSNTVSGAIKELRDSSITKWEDLDHVQKYPYANLIDYGNKITGYWYGNNGGEHHIPNTYWSIYELPVKPDTTYTIFRKNSTLDSSRYEFFNDDTHIETRQVQNATHDGWHKQVIQVPHNVNKVGICFQHNLNDESSIMAIEGDLSNVSVNFIPYIDGQLLQIGNELSLKFDNTGTNINSKTISSAIKELSNRSVDSVTSWVTKLLQQI